MQKQILNYMNIFRAIAIIMIVLGHCIRTDSSIINSVYTEVFLGGTILFIFISGFLFQHLSYKFEYKSYLYKKFINVNSPYLITSIIGLIILYCYPNYNPFNGLNQFIQIPALLSIGVVHNYSTWYIPVINIFFFMAPILLFMESKKVAGKNLLYSLIPLFLLITILCPRLAVSNSVVAGMDISYFSKYLIYINYLMHSFINIFSVYILGMCFSAHKELISQLYKYRKILIVFMLITAVADIALTCKNIYCNNSLSKIFLTLIVLAYLEHYDDFLKSKEKFNEIFNAIAQYSFGIFFLHGYLLKLWFNMILKQFHISEYLNHISVLGIFKYSLLVVATFTFAFGGSFCICYLVKKFLSLFGVKNTRAVIGA